MGNFYVNFTVKTQDAEKVAAALRTGRRRAKVLPAQRGVVLAVDQESDTQDERAIQRVGTLLSACGTVLAILNHDDDILAYWLFEQGKLVDTYNSAPDYFDGGVAEPSGGNAAKLAAAFGVPAAQTQLQNVLTGEEYDFALERHAALLEALKLPPTGVALGYNYLEEGAAGEGVDPDQIIDVS